jgi:AcrR family transcriptional regulator
MTTKRKPPKRDAEKSRARILATAIAEFSARGYSGARTATIARRAKVNVRMLYHYFGGKDALYIAVLEEVLARLRREELQLDFEDVAPLEGLLHLFDFIDGHFAQHPELRCLLAFENLNRAQHLRKSTRIPTMSSPVIGLIERLLQRGEKAGEIRAGIDPLNLYVAMVSLAYYGKSHAHTLSRIFETNLAAPQWQASQAIETRRMLSSYLLNPAPEGSE